MIRLALGLLKRLRARPYPTAAGKQRPPQMQPRSVIGKVVEMPAPALDPQDMFEIHSNVARYSLSTDNADVDAFMDCWVEPEDYGGM